MAAVRLRRLVIAALIFLAFVPASAFAATMDYLGTWSSSTTYSKDTVVKHNSGLFYSLNRTASEVSVLKSPRATAPNRPATPPTLAPKPIKQ
jgi:hypothetical protein